MGKIWLETTNGNLIHLPIVGEDFNSPDDAAKIPASIVINMARGYGEQITIVHPTLGQITLDLRPGGITGECNRCGHCCTHPLSECTNPPDCGWPYNTDLDLHVCSHLVINRINQWPRKDNTYCDLYADILNVYKGCAYPPKAINPLWVNCGYSF